MPIPIPMPMTMPMPMATVPKTQHAEKTACIDINANANVNTPKYDTRHTNQSGLNIDRYTVIYSILILLVRGATVVVFL